MTIKNNLKIDFILNLSLENNIIVDIFYKYKNDKYFL